MTDYAFNRKASFDYDILETIEAGIELLGLEVKSIRNGRAQLTGSFAIPRGMELWLTNAHIAPLQVTNTPSGYLPDRPRRLLLHRSEIGTLIGHIRAGLTVLPLRIYSKKRTIKILLGIGRRKKKYDKRETIRKRDIEREVDRTIS
jgi:SsrA-binding protein